MSPTKKASTTEAPHSCGAGGCLAIEKREALPYGVPFASRQECRGSLKDALLTGDDDEDPPDYADCFRAHEDKARELGVLYDRWQPAVEGRREHALIHDQGLVTVLRQIHDELDEAVLEACGWGCEKEALLVKHAG